MNIYLLADDPASKIEDSAVTSTFGAVLVWIFVGMVVLLIIARLAKVVEAEIMPRFAIIGAAALVGLLFVGMLHHLNLF